MKRPILTPAIAGVLVLTLSGCLPDGGADPASCEQAEVRIEMTLAADELRPSDPEACRGQDVTLVIAAEVDAVFHIHGYDDAVPATPVTAGESTEVAFTATRSGQFPIEVHPAGDPAGVEVGVLTIHEP